MLIPAKRLAGSQLQGTDGRTIGTIREVVVDRQSGRVIYLLMDPTDQEQEEVAAPHRGYPLPWQLVSYDAGKKAFRLDTDPGHLQRAPGAEAAEPIDWEDRVWAERLHEHYGLQPYWTVRSGA
ncbi:MAG TPA: PRC-barrel domain-containing protein [Kiloniellales bacterium]|jgi:sporulation protein YlmC with PRC-barrel domain|nr:PRC-barrel domain-containing protein [Kiloniellales bacterium]